jgi:Glycosyl transferase family 2/Glycosyl transferases group 1
MHEIAELLAAALADLGADAELVSDELPAERPETANVVVAPHEFFGLFDADEAAKEAAARHAVMVTTEQPGTPWFETSYRYARFGSRVLDLGVAATAVLRERGLEAHHLPLGYHASLDVWGGDDDAERPVDVVFMGGNTYRRERVLAASAWALAQLSCRLLVFHNGAPVNGARPGFLTGEERHRLLARAKVLVNVHREEAPTFEAHRLIPAIANGCVVVSEPLGEGAPLEPGETFVEATAWELAQRAAELAADPERRAELARRAYERLRERLDLTAIVSERLEHFTAPPEGERPAGEPPRPVEHGRVPNPEANGDGNADLRRALKLVIVGQQQLARRLASLECRHERGAPNGLDRVTTPGYDGMRPDVSVVIPLYNYEEFVEEAIASVLASTGVDAELVIVDDASTDGSAMRVRELMFQVPDAPIVLLSSWVNRGLPASRNIGFDNARAESVLPLDADNLLYPRCLSRLLEATREDPRAAFAYCMLERFGDGDGLLNIYPWDVERLVRGNYIDALSLVRRSAWGLVGGYREEARLHGWEDYAFWLDLAERGAYGIHVPEILARYRVHGTSMLSVTNLDRELVQAQLRTRFPGLPWPAAAAG